MVLLHAVEERIILETPSLPVWGYWDMSGIIHDQLCLYDLVGYSRPSKHADLIIAALAGR